MFITLAALVVDYHKNCQSQSRLIIHNLFLTLGFFMVTWFPSLIMLLLLSPKETNVSFSKGRTHGRGEGLAAGPLLRPCGDEETQLSDTRHGHTSATTHTTVQAPIRSYLLIIATHAHDTFTEVVGVHLSIYSI